MGVKYWKVFTLILYNTIMKKISNKKFITISLMLFSMFFGAGNFIFPPMLGKESGVIFYETILYFCLTAVVLPILGIAAVAKNGSINALAGKVDKFFGPIFIILIYLAIGPFLAIPRASNLPFEISVVCLVENKQFALCLWSIIFFTINYFIAVDKSKVVEILGKWLTPILLILIITLVTGVFFIDIPSMPNPIGKYAVAPNSTAFLEGYNTMDAMAFVFAIVVINSLRKMGITGERRIAIITIRTGIVAGIILSTIYILLAYLGATMAGIIGETTNGAEILSKTSFLLFGRMGQLILAMALFLACLTTTVGLTTSGSQYFNGLVPKISYKFWCFIFSVVSFFMANIGLTGILKYGTPILTAFYPVVIVLILLGLIDDFIAGSRLVYRSCIYVTLVTGLVYSLGTIDGLLPNLFIEFSKKIMPFYSYGLGWVFWVIVTFCITFIIHIVVSKK